MGPVAKEIRAVYTSWKRRTTSEGKICKLDPFILKTWMHYYLFPEVLEVWNDYIDEMGEPSYYYSCNTRVYPCYIIEEEEILRVMAEIGVIN